MLPAVCTLLGLACGALAAAPVAPQIPERDAPPLAHVDTNTATFAHLAKAAGLPAARAHPFVEVTTGRYSQQGNEAPVAMLCYGLLLHDDGMCFRILDERFCEVAYQRSRKREPLFGRVSYRPVEPEAIIAARQPAEPTWDSTTDLFYGWLASSIGMREQAEELFARAPLARKHRAAGLGFASASYLDLGDARYEDAIECMRDPAQTEQQRLARLDRWLTAFSEHELIDEVQSLRKAQARAIAMVLPEPTTELQQLIHDLPGTEGGIGIDGHWPFVMPVAGGSRPADRLFTLGIVAVPALLAALQDDRPTRTVRSRGLRQPRSEVMRVQRVASQILDAIAGLGIAHLDPQQTQPKFEAWWQRVQQMGATEELFARASSGDESACQRLLYVAPERLAKAVAAALPSIEQAHVRNQLLYLASQTKNAAASKLLQETVAGGDSQTIATVADAMLRQPELHQAALQALLRAWQSITPEAREATKIGRMLCAHGDRNILRTLVRHAEKLSGRELAALPRANATPPPSQELLDAQWEFLLQLIDHEHASPNGYDGMLALRLADFAAHELARRWPDRYQFDIRQLRPDRDLALRLVRGLPASPRPEAAKISPLLDQDLRQRLPAWQAETSAAERARLLAAITDPAALDRLRPLLVTASTGRSQELSTVCCRLAATVLAVGPAAELARLEPALAARFRALEDHSLDCQELTQLLGALLDAAPPGIREQTIEVSRSTNGYGLAVTIHSVPGNGEARDHPQYHATAAFDQKIVQDTTGAGVRSSVRSSAANEWVAHLATALASPDRPPREAQATKPALLVCPALEARFHIVQRR